MRLKYLIPWFGISYAILDDYTVAPWWFDLYHLVSTVIILFITPTLFDL